MVVIIGMYTTIVRNVFLAEVQLGGEGYFKS